MLIFFLFYLFSIVVFFIVRVAVPIPVPCIFLSPCHLVTVPRN